MAPDKFNQVPQLDSPADRWFAIVPNDNADLAAKPRAIYVTAAGTVRIKNDRGDDATIDLDRGWQPLRPDRVMATGTSATGLFGVY